MLGAAKTAFGMPLVKSSPSCEWFCTNRASPELLGFFPTLVIAIFPA